MELPPGARVLDVAAGNGNATLALARRWCEVTSTDYVDTLLARGRQRAEAEGLNVAFEVADVENLPYADGQQALEADLLALVARFDTATDGSMRVPSEYAEVVIARA